MRTRHAPILLFLMSLLLTGMGRTQSAEKTAFTVYYSNDLIGYLTPCG